MLALALQQPAAAINSESRGGDLWPIYNHLALSGAAFVVGVRAYLVK